MPDQQRNTDPTSFGNIFKITAKVIGALLLITGVPSILIGVIALFMNGPK